MHFRVRGNNVQIVKTQPGTGDKKTVSQPVGSANIATGKISEKVQAALTPAELQEVADWIVSYKASAAKRLELEYATIAERMEEIAVWLRRADEAVVGAHSENVLTALRSLRMALVRKSGKGKTE